jgi:hypothetical protein
MARLQKNSSCVAPTASGPSEAETLPDADQALPISFAEWLAQPTEAIVSSTGPELGNQGVFSK